MTTHPFDKSIKKYISGTDSGLDIENFEDSALLAANDVKEIISVKMYDAIAAYKTTPTPEPITPTYTAFTEALERLRYCMAPLMLYHHFIWLQLRISNNSVTTYKAQDEVTAFKYQTDEAKESLLTRYGAFLKELIDYLDTNKTIFTDWAESDQCTAMNNSLIKSYREFDSFYNTGGDAAFFVRSSSLRNEIQENDIKPFGFDLETINDLTKNKLKRVLAYSTLYRALTEWDYYYLPQPLKRTINNEHTLRNGKEIDTIKNNIAGKYKNLAEDILNELSAKQEIEKQTIETPQIDIKIKSYSASEKDKHFYM